MKKLVILIIIAVAMTSGSAFAAISQLGDNAVTAATGSSIYGGVDDADAISASKVLLGKMSKGVHFVGNLETTALVSFAAATKHTSGSKVYGTASDSTAIYFKDVGTVALGTLDQPNNGAFGATWTAM